MIILILILLGLCLGSFVNALVWRLHEKRDWVSERSECPHCHHVLAPKDLVPVLSWVLLRGKCRYCHKPIPDNPLVELTLPAVFVLSYVCWPHSLSGAGLFIFILWLLFLVGFLALAVYDLRWLLLPNVIVFPLIGLAILQTFGLVIFFGGSWHSLFGSIVGVVIISGLFASIFAISKGAWIGFGDVKLAVVLGLLAGGAVQSLLVLFTASLLGVLATVPLALRGKATRKSQLPFGPLLIVGLIVVVLFGKAVIDWYSGLIIGA